MRLRSSKVFLLVEYSLRGLVYAPSLTRFDSVSLSLENWVGRLFRAIRAVVLV
jgi:hypothetical protein